MKQLAETLVAEWCQSRGLTLTESGNLDYEDADYRCIEVRTPVEISRRMALLYSLLMTGVPNDHERQYSGGLLRITDANIWSATIDRVGQTLLVAMGADLSRSTTPTLLFEKGELVGAQTAASIPMLFEWDAYLVSSQADWLVFISHDRTVQITSRTRSLFERLFERLDDGGWQPSERIRREPF